MTHDFLPRFRHQLFDWLKVRLDDGRLPFRRVEEQPLVMTGERLATPDLVLWINRDSLLAGAMILTPVHVDPAVLRESCTVAGSLGLRQFVTWEARAVNVWETGTPFPSLLKSWPVPEARAIRATDFAGIFEQLIQELRGLAVSASLPAQQLPPAYFANLCLQVLRDVESSLLEAARMTATTGQTDPLTEQKARDKGWLTLWRLLALLRHDRFPCGVRPERLDRAIGYAIADLDRESALHLLPKRDEPTLPEIASLRFHHLAGRLMQLGWHREPQRCEASIALLCDAATRECSIETALLEPPPAVGDLLVNHLPPQSLAGVILITAWPVLTGQAMCPAARPALAMQTVMELPADCRPDRVVATLTDSQPPSPKERRERTAALRQPWPYRRLRLPAATPTWLWDALHLAGVADPDGLLQLTLPANWASAQDAEMLWQSLTERFALTELRLHADDRQTLTMVAHHRAGDTLGIHHPDGTRRVRAALLNDEPLATVAAIFSPATTARSPAPRRLRQPLADKIAARVFRDGLPNFPGDYLRRIDLPPLRSYRLPGPLQVDSCFFEQICLTTPDGDRVEASHPVDAEALQLASRDGRSEVAIPADPEITGRLINAYRADLQNLWERLLTECRRQLPAQRQAMAMARSLWQKRNLPPVEDR